jgi:hypothetical protein
MNAFLFLLITDHTRFPNYFTLLTVSHSFSTSTFIMSKINIIYAIFGIFYLFSYKKRAASIAALFLSICLAASYSRKGQTLTTIGAEELNFRVRDGNGCDLFAIATKQFFSIHCSIQFDGQLIL